MKRSNDYRPAFVCGDSPGRSRQRSSLPCVPKASDQGLSLGPVSSVALQPVLLKDWAPVEMRSEIGRDRE